VGRYVDPRDSVVLAVGHPDRPTCDGHAERSGADLGCGDDLVGRGVDLRDGVVLVIGDPDALIVDCRPDREGADWDGGDDLVARGIDAEELTVAACHPDSTVAERYASGTAGHADLRGGVPGAV
jgi:hypothetical protein